MELESYRNFLAIVEAGSFTAAAECVHVAQPALSKQLRSLENYFGAKLIITNRGSRQLLLTEAGRTLYQKAKYICSLEDLAKSEIDNIMGGSTGTLRISIANSRAAQFISSSLKDFCQLYPNISYELYESSISEQSQQLLNGVTEIGIFSTPINDHQDSFDILFRRSEDFVAIFHNDAVWLDGNSDTITIKELCSMPLSISAGCAGLFKSACLEQGLTPHILSTNTTRFTTMRWVAERTSVGVIAIEPEEFMGKNFVVKKISDLDADVYKTVVKVKGRPLSVVAQKFLKFYAKTRGSQQVCNLDELLQKERF